MNWQELKSSQGWLDSQLSAQIWEDSLEYRIEMVESALMTLDEVSQVLTTGYDYAVVRSESGAVAKVRYGTSVSGIVIEGVEELGLRVVTESNRDQYVGDRLALVCESIKSGDAAEASRLLSGIVEHVREGALYTLSSVMDVVEHAESRLESAKVSLDESMQVPVGRFSQLENDVWAFAVEIRNSFGTLKRVTESAQGEAFDSELSALGSAIDTTLNLMSKENVKEAARIHDRVAAILERIRE